jgi:hypothetical protein
VKLFIKKIIIFSIIFLLYLIIACWIDPYNIIHVEHNPKLIELKSQISYKFNYPLYKLQQYTEQPTDVVLLGDSRTDKLNSSKFAKVTQLKTTNLAYGGGTLPEIIDTFWYVTKIHKVKQVYIGINFNLYNEYNNMNRVKGAVQLIESPLSYLFSNYCVKSLYFIIKSSITKKNITIGVPTISKEEFWKYQLEVQANNFYHNYKYPASYQNSLIEIISYCKDNNIQLIFFIPPTHIDLQQKIKEFNLMNEEKLFKIFLSTSEFTYDFDYPNEITRCNTNFSDPFHYNDSISNIIINTIVGNNKSQVK